MTDDFDCLLQRARAGDGDAVAELLERNLGGLRAFIRLRCGAVIRARESSSDLVQSVCREVLEDIGDLRGDDETLFKQWLFSVAHHKILRKARYHGAQRRDVRGERAVSPDELLGCYASLVTPSRHAEADEEIRRIEAAVDQLPDEFRRVLIEARMLGRSHREIAAGLGKSVAAVRQILVRARARLALMLEGVSP